MRRGSEPTFTTRVKVLLAVFSSPGSGAAAICSVLAPAPPISNIKVSVWRLPSGPRVMARAGQHLGLAGADIAHGQVDFRARVSALVQGDLGGDARTGQRARRDHGIVQFDVMRGALASEAHGVNGNVAGAQRADGVRADAAGVVVAIAEQHHGADGQVGSLVAQLLEAVADAGRGRVGLQILEALDAGGHGRRRGKDAFERSG